MKKRQVLRLLQLGIPYMTCLIRISTAQSQPDAISLQTIEISDNRLNSFATGSSQSPVDSATLALMKGETLASLLKTNGSFSVRDYGAGGIATLSARGTAATHTGITWNGFLLNTPSLGLCDVSRLPLHAGDQVTLFSGGNNVINGNASMGGIISMETKPDFTIHGKTGISFNLSDAENYYATAYLSDGNTKRTNSTRFFYGYNNNRFHFINTTKKGNPEEIMQHARVTDYGLFQSNGFRLKRNQQIQTGIWYQVTGRQQPPLMTSSVNKAFLKDSIFRIYAAYDKKWTMISLTARVAYFDESESYNDPRIGLSASYKIKSYKSDVSGRIILNKKIWLDNGIRLDYYQVGISEYQSDRNEARFSVYSGMHYQPAENLRLRLTVRKQQEGKTTSPLLPSAGLEYNLKKGFLVFRVNAGRNYNLPSLNDRYWKPGGNTGLQSENGWGSEGGITLSPDKKRNLQIGISFYEMVITNWIQWYPWDSTGLYKACNLKKVYVRGLESTARYSLVKGGITFRLNGSFSYTHSTSEEVNAPSAEIMEGKQLVYVPFCSGNLSALVAYRSFILSYDHSFTGERYCTSDNRQSLDPYSTGTVTLGKEFLYRRLGFGFLVKINNVWNHQYQVMKNHAMPMRYFSFGLNLDINYIKNKQLL